MFYGQLMKEEVILQSIVKWERLGKLGQSYTQKIEAMDLEKWRKI